MGKLIDPKLLPDIVDKSRNDWKKFYNKNKKKLEGMDLQVHALHDKISAQTDCLSCGNCCRTLGPRITDKDVEKIGKALRLKTNDVIAKYFRIDEDNDMVFQNMPCPFLGTDNYCSIYESRPKACREYPHTDRKRFYQIYTLSVKNAETCPIVYQVLEGLTKG